MWVNPMLTIWLYVMIGGTIVFGAGLWKWYFKD